MILTHNIKKSRVAQIVAVMRESTKATGVLSASDGCYCALGCIVEAYRRAHPDEASWTEPRRAYSGRRYRNFIFKGITSFYHFNGTLPIEVKRWALKANANDVLIKMPEGYRLMDSLNDNSCRPLSWFADVLEGKEVEL